MASRHAISSATASESGGSPSGGETASQAGAGGRNGRRAERGMGVATSPAQRRSLSPVKAIPRSGPLPPARLPPAVPLEERFSRPIMLSSNASDSEGSEEMVMVSGRGSSESRGGGNQQTGEREQQQQQQRQEGEEQEEQQRQEGEEQEEQQRHQQQQGASDESKQARQRAAEGQQGGAAGRDESAVYSNPLYKSPGIVGMKGEVAGEPVMRMDLEEDRGRGKEDKHDSEKEAERCERGGSAGEEVQGDVEVVGGGVVQALQNEEGKTGAVTGKRTSGFASILNDLEKRGGSSVTGASANAAAAAESDARQGSNNEGDIARRESDDAGGSVAGAGDDVGEEAARWFPVQLNGTNGAVVVECGATPDLRLKIRFCHGGSSAPDGERAIDVHAGALQACAMLGVSGGFYPLTLFRSVIVCGSVIARNLGLLARVRMLGLPASYRVW